MQRGTPRTLLRAQRCSGLAQACLLSCPAPSLASHISLGPQERTELEFHPFGLGRLRVWKHLHSRKRRTWRMGICGPR